MFVPSSELGPSLPQASVPAGLGVGGANSDDWRKAWHLTSSVYSVHLQEEICLFQLKTPWKCFELSSMLLIFFGPLANLSSLSWVHIPPYPAILYVFPSLTKTYVVKITSFYNQSRNVCDLHKFQSQTVGFYDIQFQNHHSAKTIPWPPAQDQKSI